MSWTKNKYLWLADKKCSLSVKVGVFGRQRAKRGGWCSRHSNIIMHLAYTLKYRKLKRHKKHFSIVGYQGNKMIGECKLTQIGCIKLTIR